MTGKWTGWAVDKVGGKARLKVIVAFACVLGLDGADKGAVGAMAGPLQQALGVGKTEIGLLLTASIALGAIATLPFGWLVDRVNRTRLLAWVILLWGAAMILCGTATSYLYLLGTRLLLSGVTACAGPAVASLIGDYVPPAERARTYSSVLAGEFIGTGIGFLVSGELAVWTWRAGFMALAIPAFILAWAIFRLPEPERGGASRIARGQEHLRGGEGEGAGEPGGGEAGGGVQERKVQALSREQQVEPRERLLLEENPRDKSLWWAAIYVLKIPSNVVLIIASALGYYFLAGVRTFGVEYFHEWYGISHATATVLVLVLGAGALTGVIFSGRLADWLIRKGKLRARVAVAVTAYLATTGLLVPALLATGILFGMIFFTLAATALGAVNPPLDAARLDIMHPGLWGRAESVRTLLRQGGEAIAPLIFGYTAVHVFAAGTRSPQGLHDTFLVMLIPLAAGGLIGLIGLRTYARDVASAEENARRTEEPGT